MDQLQPYPVTITFKKERVACLFPPPQSCIRNIEIHVKSNSRYIMCLSWIISPNISLHFTHHHIAPRRQVTSVYWQGNSDSPFILNKASTPFCLFHHCNLTVSLSVMAVYQIRNTGYSTIYVCINLQQKERSKPYFKKGKREM